LQKLRLRHDTEPHQKEKRSALSLLCLHERHLKRHGTYDIKSLAAREAEEAVIKQVRALIRSPEIIDLSVVLSLALFEHGHGNRSKSENPSSGKAILSTLC
jgi:hypothetical protein